MIRNTERSLKYSIALLLSSAKRKTFESLGEEMRVSGDTASRLATENIATHQELIEVANKIFGKKRVYLLIDDTLILKIYSRCIEGTSDNFSSSDNKAYRSLCSIVGMLSDGEIAIPIDQKIWTSKEFMSENKYQKKWELAQQLILNLKKYVSFEAVIMDGLYAIDAFMRWLNSQNINFEMRFHSNRVIEINNQRHQIKNHQFKLIRGRNSRTIRASWKGESYYFTAFKRRLANGDFTTVFQVSNFKAPVKKHTQIYSFRWNIEKFFRTAKQKLGLNDCQSRKLERQEGHILKVFIAYAFAQVERVKQKLKNVETAIKSIKSMNSKKLNCSISRFREIFRYV